MDMDSTGSVSVMTLVVQPPRALLNVREGRPFTAGGLVPTIETQGTTETITLT